MEAEKKPWWKKTFTWWEVSCIAIGCAMAPILRDAMRDTLTWQNAKSVPPTATSASRSMTLPVFGRQTIPPAQVATTSYSPEFEKWWGGHDADLTLVQTLEGKVVELYGILPNERQKQYIRDTFGPTLKQYTYYSYQNGAKTDDQLDAVGKRFVEEYCPTYFDVLLSFSDKEQLNEMRKAAK